LKIHYGIKELYPERIPEIEKNARKVGLDKIDFERFYTLIKMRSKRKSQVGYPDKFVAAKGLVSIVGDQGYVWISVENDTGWFKTSPVISCKKVKNGYKIETENSFYRLEAGYAN
jgi:hypothetical protein